MKLEIHPAVEDEVQDAALWYDQKKPGLGDEFMDELSDAMDQVLAHPLRFPIVHTIRGRQFRKFLLARFPYAVVYESDGRLIHIFAVAHAARKPMYWTQRTI
jgi:toxin ParE1/3/4